MNAITQEWLDTFNRVHGAGRDASMHIWLRLSLSGYPKTVDWRNHHVKAAVALIKEANDRRIRSLYDDK